MRHFMEGEFSAREKILGERADEINAPRRRRLEDRAEKPVNGDGVIHHVMKFALLDHRTFADMISAGSFGAEQRAEGWGQFVGQFARR